jgi:hypothetical protein
MAFLRCCYHQILGPRRHLPKLSNGLCRHSDAWVYLDPHLIRQATKSYVERGKISHEGFRSLTPHSLQSLYATRDAGLPGYVVVSCRAAHNGKVTDFRDRQSKKQDA